MSTVYYLRNKQKYKEYKAFEKFWKKLVKEAKNSVAEYCKKTAGELVNADLAETIIDDTLSKISRYPIDDDKYNARLFTVTTTDVIYAGYAGCFTEKGTCIWNDVSFEAFTKTEEAKQYQIVDECGRIRSYQEMIKLLKDRQRKI